MSDTPPEEPGRPAPDIDLGRLAADDALLDALGRGQQAPDDTDPAAEVLAAFRAGLDEQAAALPGASPVTPPVLTPVTVAAASGRHRWTGRAAAVAAVGVVLVSGTGVAAALTAQPGDLLYGVRRAVVGPVDDSYRKDAEALVDQTARLSGGRVPITRPQQAELLDHAADLVAGIKDPGRKKAMVRRIASARAALGLPSKPIPTAGTPLASPGPTTDVAALAPGPVISPTVSPSPSATPSPSASASTSTAPEAGTTPSASASASASASPTASASPSHHRRRPSPSASPSATASASGPTYTYVPRRSRPRPSPSPTPSPTFIIG
jgi:hypothetical protein